MTCYVEDNGSHFNTVLAYLYRNITLSGIVVCFVLGVVLPTTFLYLNRYFRLRVCTLEQNIHHEKTRMES